MRKRLWISVALVLIIPGLLFTASCAKKAARGTAAEAPATESDEDAKKRAMEAQKEAERQAALQNFENEMVHFAFDKSSLDMTAQDVLKRKAAWLEANPDVQVVIEGHCDERGTPEYNLALGERRASSAKQFLVNAGIPSARLLTVSFGEELPLDTASNETAWALNRRAQFKLK